MQERELTEREQEEALEKVARVMLFIAQAVKKEATKSEEVKNDKQ